MNLTVTGIDCRSRTSDDNSDRSLDFRYDKKITKQAKLAEENGFQFIPAIFSYTGQMHDLIRRLIRVMIRHKLILFEGEA